MNTKRIKILLALTNAALLIAVTLLTSPLPQTASAFERVQGQDKTGKNCERVDTPESSTFGKCESVCKDKEVTRDALNNRWVCKAAKTVKTIPLGQAATGGVKVLDAGTNPKPKLPTTAGTKTGKAKKN